MRRRTTSSLLFPGGTYSYRVVTRVGEVGSGPSEVIVQWTRGSGAGRLTGNTRSP